MILFVLLILCVIFLGSQTAGKGKYFDDYISQKQTYAINGAFTLFVFLSHISTYFDLTGIFDIPYEHVKYYLSQLIVVSFLFYSGYGMMESIKKKGMDYVKSIPLQRFFKVFYHMEIAVLMYVAVNLILGNWFTVSTTLLSFVGWTNIGNSNWYIFVVLAMYLFVFVSFMLARGNKYIATVLTTVFTVAFAAVLLKLGKETFWYNTIVLYPVGMIFSLVKDLFDKIVKRNDVLWVGIMAAVFVTYNVFEYLRKGNLIYYYIWAVLFMMLIVILTTKVRIGNVVLNRLGSHVFSIYMLQRIPMMILSKFGFNTSHRYIFVALCFVMTLILSALFDKATGKLDSLIYYRKKLN
ncbi:MAG: hypothetical protein NC122_09410 [Faecalibacterium sp.]|nr:hypothetical protein [Ruminococcus sp.]MCM1392853.1 hypothetical protein [Ruminococcus sp.]MCM1486408.1 hypothetical protein [Faecalibacterium sp.]